MKTITGFITATLLFFAASVSNAQSMTNGEEITAETFIRLENNDFTDFAVSPLRVENAGNGFVVKWQTVNDKPVALFEVQISEDRKNFTTVKRLQRYDSQGPLKIYAAEFNNTVILSDKAYFRIKSILINGAANYTDITAVKIRQAK